MSAVLAPDTLLHELTDLWVRLGKEGQAETGAGVLRACSMTLVVVADETDDFSALGETIAALMPEHPARTVVVRLQAAKQKELSGRVFAQCWMPFGQRRQICCEQIEITASETSLADAASLIEPLAAPDLPVILWCRSARVVEQPAFQGLAAMARKVVVDTSGWPDPKAALRRLSEMKQRGIILGDLSWTRLTRWRQMLAQLFENRELPAKLSGISLVRVGFGGKDAPVSARYLGAWLIDSLADAGVRAQLVLDPDPRGTTGHLQRLELKGEAFRVELKRRGSRLVIAVDQLSHCTHLPHPNDYLLMREETAIVTHDAIFERTLSSAERL